MEVEGLVEGVVVLGEATACPEREGEEDGSPGVVVDEAIVAVVCKHIYYYCPRYNTLTYQY